MRNTGCAGLPQSKLPPNDIKLDRRQPAFRPVQSAPRSLPLRTSIPFSALLLLAGLLLAVAPAASQQDRASSGTTSIASADEQAAAARRELLRRFRYGNLAEIELSGKKVMVSYADLATDSDDYPRLRGAGGRRSLGLAERQGDQVQSPMSRSPSATSPCPTATTPRTTPASTACGPSGPRTAGAWSSTPRATSGVPSAIPPRTRPKCLSITRGPTNRPKELTVEFLDVEPGAKALPKEAAGEKVLRIAWGDHQFLAAFEAAP